MRHLSFSVDVHASRKTVWKLMVEKVEDPGEYLPGVEETAILDRRDDALTRQVRTHGMTIKEKVTIDEGRGEISYLLMEHPLLAGRVVNRVVSGAVQSPVAPQRFTIEMEWAPKDDDAERIIWTDMPAQIQREVMSLKARAEELDKE